MKILLVGDVVGSPGRRILKATVARLRREGAVHAVVANCENAASGSGLTAALGEEILGYGVDAITLGDHVWDQKDTAAYLARERRVVRPANLPGEFCPGHGWTSIQTELGPLVVVSLMARTFMRPCDCPFRCIDALLSGPVPRNTPVVVDFHGEATSEKIAIGWHLDGRVSAVVGTHTHVQTSDERVLPNGTAYITDLGMTGPRNSVIGREVQPVIRKFLSGMPARLEVPSLPAVLEGAIVEIDRTTGRAVRITRIREFEDGAE